MRKFIWRSRLVCFGLSCVGLTSGSVLAAPASAQTNTIFPAPALVQPGAGRFSLTAATPIILPPSDKGAAEAVAIFRDLLAQAGLRVKAATLRRGPAIRFVRLPNGRAESYRLTVTPRGATIAASTDAGLLYGAISLWQLASASPDAGATRSIDAMTIEDAPRFAWRGLMLDSARHYQSPVFIRRLLDAMAVSKLNTLHWHLVDDQGWRLQIRKYPKLTEVGAFRRPATAAGAPPLPATGGFYTQDEVRSLVAYAAARNITIVPEIEMPGHALSAIRAYPGLGTGVVPPPGIESDWGVFPYLYNTDDATFGFLQDVLDEVMALFPSTYIHIGGDEAVKDQWRASPAIQAKMHAVGATDENALQSWFIGRIGRYLKAHGRRMIGWDEILDGGIPADATVMSWRGMDGALAAAKAGHDTVLSPSPTLYLNHREARDDPLPGRNEVIDLAKVYAFDPAPASLSADQQRHILGVQGNMWTEHARTEARVAAKMFPRGLAVAELGWSPPATRNYTRFVDCLVPQLDRLASLGILASPAALAPEATLAFDGKSAIVSLRNGVGLPIRYTTDGTAPGPASPMYRTPLSLRLPTRIRAATFRDTRPVGTTLDRLYDAKSIRRRTSLDLATCAAPKAQLALEDDAPATGARAVFLTDILAPCWRYENAPLDGVDAISLTVGRIPFNFQVGHDRDAIKFRPPSGVGVAFEVRAGCKGPVIATLPLTPALGNPALTTLRTRVAPLTGAQDLCFTYTATGPDPMWAIDSVQLEQAR